MLTLGNRFAENEDLLLSTYLHEQMHWYLWHLGTPERDMVAPFFDELVRRYPDAPTELPDGARNYEPTYLHLVVNWLEIAATSEFIGRARACRGRQAQRTYRWIYRTVLKDWDLLGELYERHGMVPIRTRRDAADAENAKAPQAPRSTAAREKSPQQRRRARLLDPAVHLGRVVAGRLAEDARRRARRRRPWDRRRRSRAGGRAQTRWPPRTSDRAPA